MIPKAAIVFISCLFLFKLAFVLCLNPDLYQYDHGVHEIINGEINKESLLYKGRVRGMNLSGRVEYWKETCYPNNDDDKKPNEHVQITGFNVTDELFKGTERIDEAVVFPTSGGVDQNQVCWFFLTKPSGGVSYEVTVYGKRLVDKEPPIKPGQILRQPMDQEMFQEPYELPPLIISAKSPLAERFRKIKKYGGREVIIRDN